jgi:hypothetical protein
MIFKIIFIYCSKSSMALYFAEFNTDVFNELFINIYYSLLNLDYAGNHK